MSTSQDIQDFIGQNQTRAFEIEREITVDEENRTVNLAFASDKPVEHWFGYLRLSMDKKAIRTERLKNGAPLLLDHDRRCQIGVIEGFSFDKDGIARADVKFSRSEKGEEIFQDVKDGIRRCVSVGFIVHALELESEKKNEPPVYRSDDWEVLEISLVSIPADISVGVGREQLNKENIEDAPEKREKIEENFMPEENKPAPSDAANQTRTVAEFVEFAGNFGDEYKDLARSYALDGKSFDDLKTAIREKRDKPQPEPPPRPAEAVAQANGVQLARALPRHAKLRNFTGEDAAQRAFRFGQWILGGMLGNERAAKYCADNNILLRAQNETVNEKGGFLVPEEFGNDLIDLREQYGVFRRNAKVVPMMSDTRSDPRRTGGLTAYFVGESEAITVSEKNWDRVQLTAKKLSVLARYTSEVNEDSVISMADDLAGEIAYAFANKEDECGFNGDGTSTYGGIVGVREKLKGLSGTIANIAGLQVGTGNAYSELTLADFEGVVGLLPQYADTPMAKWFVHRSFYYNVMVKVMLASGGVTAAEIEGARNQRFLGYGVEFTQVMPKAEANSQVCALFGDLSKAACFGSRRDTTLALSEHSRFANDEIEIRGTERFDINVHDVGNATATAADKQPGPIVGLITAAG